MIRNYIKWNRYHSENGIEVFCVCWFCCRAQSREVEFMTLRLWIMDKLLYDRVSLSFSQILEDIMHRTAHYVNKYVEILSWCVCVAFVFNSLYFLYLTLRYDWIPKKFSSTSTSFLHSDLFILFTYRISNLCVDVVFRLLLLLL